MFSSKAINSYNNFPTLFLEEYFVYCKKYSARNWFSETFKHDVQENEKSSLPIITQKLITSGFVRGSDEIRESIADSLPTNASG